MSKDSSTFAWKALESDPEIFTNIAHQLLNVKDQFYFEELYTLDTSDLELIYKTSNTNIYGCILFYGREVAQDCETKCSEDTILDYGNDNNVFFLSQVKGLGDACGTIAIIHNISNIPEILKSNTGNDNILFNFIKQSAEKNYTERGNSLYQYNDIYNIHNSNVQLGQSQVINNVGDSQGHFIAFVKVKANNNTYNTVLLDGTKPGPKFINNINSSFEFLTNTIDYIKQCYIKNNNNITMMILRD